MSRLQDLCGALEEIRRDALQYARRLEAAHRAVNAAWQQAVALLSRERQASSAGQQIAQRLLEADHKCRLATQSLLQASQHAEKYIAAHCGKSGNKVGTLSPPQGDVNAVSSDAPSSVSDDKEGSDRDRNAPYEHAHNVDTGGQGVTHDAGNSRSIGAPAPGDRSTTREKWQAERSCRRAERSVDNVDQPLENPKPTAAKKGHGHSRHGYQTTDEQQATRVRTGRAPNGLRVKPHPVRASRFRSAQAEAEALGRARTQLEADLRNGTVDFHTDPVTGQQLYVHPATGIPVRHRVSVPTNDPRGFGESAQVARRVGGLGSPPALDANGSRIPDLIVAPQKTATVSYEYVPSANEWRPVTYFPEP
ncbi:hypothetical protein [Amycolatopsis alba]|uniref:hypothetical protein n=1 Tax=Amycolatopsis alba TaxID=76020 RepID=UPI0011788FBE|nr:hypothetical protein [Amycolatopsis alba]